MKSPHPEHLSSNSKAYIRLRDEIRRTDTWYRGGYVRVQEYLCQSRCQRARERWVNSYHGMIPSIKELIGGISVLQTGSGQRIDLDSRECIRNGWIHSLPRNRGNLYNSSRYLAPKEIHRACVIQAEKYHGPAIFPSHTERGERIQYSANYWEDCELVLVSNLEHRRGRLECDNIATTYLTRNNYELAQARTGEQVETMIGKNRT